VWAKLANAIGFQLVWLCCVAGAGAAYGWIGPLAAAIFAVFVIATGGQARNDLRLLVLTVPLGAASDSLFAASGWLHYAQPWPSAMLAPAWIVAMWVGFALTLNHSLAFLRQRPLLSALLGLACGPLAYLTAERVFHAVVIAAPTLPALSALAIGWAILLPLLFRMDRQFVVPQLREAGA
jgi:hypothetical protein